MHRQSLKIINLFALKIGLLITLLCITASSTYGSDFIGEWKWNFRTHFGAIFSNEIATRNTNATGGEQLIGRLGTGYKWGFDCGLYNDVFGFDINWGITSAIDVKNEFGVDFPNHSDGINLFSFNAFVHPFSISFISDSWKPYVTAGVGYAIISIDSDNNGNREIYAQKVWNYGVGLRYTPHHENQKDKIVFFDLSFRNYRISSIGPVLAFEVQSVCIGIGATL